MSETPAVWTSRLTTPGAGAFAVLFGIEALGRALVAAALPLQTLELMGSDEGVSILFLVGSVAAIGMAFVVPRLVPWIGRARVVTFGILLIAGAAGLFTFQELPSQVLGFVLRACGVAILYAGLSLFIMDHIRRVELGRSEPLRMLSVGLGWTLGPFAGVQMEAHWGPDAPFLASALAAAVLLGYFWTLRFRPAADRARQSEPPGRAAAQTSRPVHGPAAPAAGLRAGDRARHVLGLFHDLHPALRGRHRPGRGDGRPPGLDRQRLHAADSAVGPGPRGATAFGGSAWSPSRSPRWP